MNLQARVVNILTRPAGEWQVIAAEPADIASLYTSYIGVLAAIPAVALLVGLLGFFGSYGASFAVRAAVVGYAAALIGTFIAAFVVEKLAPNFDSSGNTAQALKLVAYSTTPVWIAGVFHLVPALSALIILAWVYALYLFYLGLTPVMKTPGDKVVPYMIVSAVVVVLVNVLLGLLLGGASAFPGAIAL